ncbi:family 16 glycosylhydrolase [Streptomyces calidiresistens]|uniref:Family 16 glycosylhydrolase n=2 Tax=Streptomyces calidiresistens TaxID=1485586 RepID=A0A7W3XWW7_9ACTN|nr:family 16 glycosylhydrolase [Streptomyces calidiresistens]
MGGTAVALAAGLTLTATSAFGSPGDAGASPGAAGGTDVTETGAADATEEAGVRANTVVFEDTFDGPAGAAPDESRWNTEVGDNVHNNELQYYTPGNANAALDGEGNLVITARETAPGESYPCWYGECEYTSARINTSGKFAAEYGRVEARIKVPAGQGMWPAFWMLGDDFHEVDWPASGEIDIMEYVGYDPHHVFGYVHGPGYSGDSGIGGSYRLPGGEPIADDFRTFAVDWAPDSITWLVDDVPYQTLTPADLDGNEWVFNKPFFLILNLAVGGNWPGSPDETTVFPAELVVDHVRVSVDEASAAALD